MLCNTTDNSIYCRALLQTNRLGMGYLWHGIPSDIVCPSRNNQSIRVNMEAKYYTPELHELHEGFEYEDGFTHAEFCPKMYSYNEVARIGRSLFLKALDNKRIRVKCLDREDIESENWKYSDSRKIDEPNHKIDISIFRRRKDDSFYYTLTIDNLNPQVEVVINQLNSGYRQIIFIGKILNKSELKRIQKQLNIE